MRVRLATLIIAVVAALLWYIDPARQERLISECGNGGMDDRVAACTRLLEGEGVTPTLRQFAYAKRAEARHIQKNYELAIADATRALELAPEDTRALVWRAYSHHAIGDRVASDLDFERALQIAPDDLYVLSERARLYTRQIDTARALEFRRRVLGLNPMDEKAGEAFVAAALNSGRYDPAYEAVVIAKERWPDSAWV